MHPTAAWSIFAAPLRKGYRNIENFRRDPDLDPLRGTPEFEELVKELEEKVAKDERE
ncbi:MAG: hypothetical protein ABI778_09775 [Ignavibacteriota bacterium]